MTKVALLPQCDLFPSGMGYQKMRGLQLAISKQKVLQRSILFCLLLAAVSPADAQACTIGTNSMTNVSGLVFGAVFGGAGGSVTVASNGARTATGAVPVTISTVASPAAASFSVCANNNGTATFSFPSTVVLTSGANSMTVGNFTSSAPSGLSVSSSSAPNVTVGATLNVSADQAPGNYSGTFQVTVTYQ